MALFMRQSFPEPRRESPPVRGNPCELGTIYGDRTMLTRMVYPQNPSYHLIFFNHGHDPR